jgi:gamma-glutamyltranspeptidase / glutathione hydrolase
MCSYNTTYRGEYMVTEIPPNPQGIAALQMLNILETFNLSAMGHNTADYLHVHIEVRHC